MLKAARKSPISTNWKKYEQNASIRLRSGKNKRKSKPKLSRPKSKVILGVTALLFLVVLILVSKLFGYLGNINEPYSKDSSKIGSWNGKSPFNLVVKADSVYLLSYQPKDKSMSILKFPSEVYIDIPYNFGKWPIRSIYDLGQAEKPPIGAKLLKDSVGNSFNLIVDGYIILNDDSVNLLQNAQKGKGNVLPGINILSKSKTDLNLIEYLRIWWSIKNVRSDKIKTVDLEKSNLTQWLLLPDGSRVISLDPVKLSQFEEGRFVDTNIQDETLSIGIYNATDYPGLAEKAAKIITNLGGRVIFALNAPEKTEKSMILAKNGYSTDYLSQTFRLLCPQPKSANFWQKIPLFGLNKSLPCSSENNNLDMSRADIIIILGEDSFLKYSKK